jgi:GT2 family glycosyltransferase
VTLGARPELSPEQRALLLAWFDRRRATVLASLSNGAWRGAEPIAPSDRFYGALSAARVEVEPAFEAGSQIITEKYYAPSAYADPDLTVSNLVVELRARLRRAPTARAPSPALLEGGVSVITPYFRHRRFFPECAASVALMFEITRSVSETALEWVVINDDPSMTAADLLSMVPAALRNRTRIIDGGGMGTTRATNAGIEAARHGWLLFLDCDDMILPDAVVVMDHYARTQGGRYFSSALIDIDEDGRVIRYRPHLKPPGRAPAAGMIAGHLKAVHRSAFTDLGELNPLFDSCQDYDFLLRVLEAEDVILVPEYLYQYRWHDQTQSVSKVFEQERRVLEIKKVFVEGRQASVRDCPSGPAHTAGRIRIGAVIRSTGERTLSLLEAIASCRTLSDAIVIRPIVVVHGDDARVDFVRDLLARHGHGPETLDLLQAGEPDRLRGYPLNVGAEHALTVAGCHAFGILDDDDVYLPGMELMAFLAADDRPLVLAGRTLCRGLDGDVEELYPLLPSAVLLKQNFLPTNGVLFNAAAAGAVKERFGSMFPEDMHYLEDWVFLIRAIAADVPYRFFDRFVGEFRMGSDGNTGLRRRPFEFEKCTVKAHTLARQVARDMGARLEPHVVNLPQKLAGRMSADEVELALAWTAQSV